MKERAIIWWLWGANHVVLREYLAEQRLVVIVPDQFCPPPLRKVIEEAGSTLVVLESLVPGDVAASMKGQADERAATIVAQMGSPAWKNYCHEYNLDWRSLGAKLSEHLPYSLLEEMFLIEAFIHAHSRYAIELMVLNEDYQRAPRTAALWARSVGIPTLHVEHALPALNPYTVHTKLEADYLLVSGERAREAYLDVGFPGERIAVMGFPGADKYVSLKAQKRECRQYLIDEYKLDPALPVVVFGSTWHSNPLSALADPDLYKKSFESFFCALNRLHVLGIAVNAIIKDRPGNLPDIADPEKGGGLIAERIRGIGKRMGVGEHRYAFTMKDAPLLVAGSDVLVAIDSALSVEAMLAGTVTVNLVNFFGLRYGPIFESDSGVLEAEFATLGDVLARLMTTPQLMEQAKQAMAGYVEKYNFGYDGLAAKRMAKFMVDKAVPPCVERNAVEPSPEEQPPQATLESVRRPVKSENSTPAPRTNNTNDNEDQMSDSKLVLHVGCGPENAAGLHPVFQGPGWREVRLDIDPDVKPEIVGTLTDMGMVPDTHADAVWSSHNVEHIFSHQVPIALREFYRVLKPGGFALVTLPDLQAAAEMVAADQLDEMAYLSPAGPIAPIDMIYSYRRFLLDENEFMCHRTGFTARTLYRALRSAGFSSVVVERHNFCLWATAWKDFESIPKSMAGLNGKVFAPQDEDEILVGCRLWKKGQEGNQGSYRTLHELRITAGIEQLALAVLLERPEESAFISNFVALLNRCQLRARVVVIAPFAPPAEWQDSEQQEWLTISDGSGEIAEKVLQGMPADWIGLLKLAAPAYGRPQGVVSLMPGNVPGADDQTSFGVLVVDQDGDDAPWKATLASLQRQTHHAWKFVVLSKRSSPGGVFDATDDFGWLELDDMNDTATLGKALSALVGITKVSWFTLMASGQTLAVRELTACAETLVATPDALVLWQDDDRAPWFHASLASALPEAIQPVLAATRANLMQYARHQKGEKALTAVVYQANSDQGK